MFIFIDAHVHIYPEFSLDKFFSSAWNNFSLAVNKSNISVSDNIVFVLALTEGAGCDAFASLKKQAVSSSESSEKPVSTTSWEVCLTTETDSLCIRSGGSVMYLTAGRQFVSTENIELLSLFSSVVIPDHSLSLEDLACTVSVSGGLPVIPWGVGKWFGRRGRVVESLLNTKHEFPLFVGDNGNRSVFWPLPVLLRRAAGLAIPLLSGSDPLPLAAHARRPGSFGSIMKCNEVISFDAPSDLLRRLVKEKHEISSFGHGVGPIQFIIDQLQVNLRKQLAHKSSQ